MKRAIMGLALGLALMLLILVGISALGIGAASTASGAQVAAGHHWLAYDDPPPGH